MDINDSVLAAYQAEHKEHIEGIRSLLSELGHNPVEPGDQRLDEAFRLAHSLKGGAHVCDLRPAEQLGHHLESLFASVRQGELEWQDPAEQMVSRVLDLIEDWMAALADDQPLPETDETVAAIGHLLAGDSPSKKHGIEATPSLSDELRSAFSEEYTTYVEGLRKFLASQRPANPPTSQDADEAFRYAHCLHSAARAAELADIEVLGHEMVEILAPLRSGGVDCDGEFLETATSLLDRIDAAVRKKPTHAASRPSKTKDVAFAQDSTTGRGGDDDAVLVPKDPIESRSTATTETVRVETGSLDRLIHCSGQLMSELAGLDDLAGALGDLGQDVELMRRERENLRESISVGLHQLGNLPEFGQLVRYFNTIDRQLVSLSRRAHHLRRVQHRHLWHLRSRGEQVHQAARQARMVPVESMFQSFRKMVRNLARDEKKQIEFVFRGLDRRADRLVLQALKDPLMHVLRNAVVHGIESPSKRKALAKSEKGTVELVIEATGSSLCIHVSDDGRGLDWSAVRSAAVERGLVADDDAETDPSELVKWVFEPGFTTVRNVSELAGRGMGLSVLHAAVERLQGEIRLESVPGSGTRIDLTIPLLVSTHRVLLVRAGTQTYAIPTSAVERLLRVARSDIEILEGSPFVNYQNKPIPLVALLEQLGVAKPEKTLSAESLWVVVVKPANQLLAVTVDELLAERDVIIHDLTGPAVDVPHFSGAVLLGNGSVAPILDVGAIAGKPAGKSTLFTASTVATTPEAKTRTVLIVDDSFTTPHAGEKHPRSPRIPRPYRRRRRRGAVPTTVALRGPGDLRR